MSKTAIPPKVANALWAKAAGRCQFRGCNKLLIGDLISSKRTGKFGFIAHIVADEAGGPRGDAVRSPLFAQDIDNLMLMCPIHLKAIDVDYLAHYPEDVLLAMKAEHEDRIEIVTDMDVDRVSHVVRFAATIGQRDSLVTTRSIFSAMTPHDDILVVGEGIETMLSVVEAVPGLPVWAALSVGHLGAVLLPEGLQRLYIAIDRDLAGQRAAERLSARATEAGVVVRVFRRDPRPLCLRAPTTTARPFDHLKPGNHNTP